MPQVEIGAGELIDKIAILEIKSQRISDPKLRDEVLVQLRLLCVAREASIAGSDGLDRLSSDLKAVNGELWDAEAAIRKCEAEGSFEHGFVALARSIYKLNDRRAALKREIDILAGSRITDVKSYGK